MMLPFFFIVLAFTGGSVAKQKACFTRQTNIDHGNGGRWMKPAERMHILLTQAAQIELTTWTLRSWCKEIRTAVKDVVVNLDLPPNQRWTHVVTPLKPEMAALIDEIKILISDKVLEIVDKSLAKIVSRLPQPYQDELKGIAQATNIDIGEVILYNIFYEIFTLCTSIVGQDPQGKLYHARNLDFGLFLGWDKSNDTWRLPELLRPLVKNVVFQKGGKDFYKGVHFAGYVGIISGMKPGVFSLTINERFNIDGGYIGLIEWLLGMNDAKFMGFFARDLMETGTSYGEVKQAIMKTPLIAPAYYILGGARAGEGCVITRSRTKSLDVHELAPSNGTWYVLETNYDRWKAPLFLDDRRTPRVEGKVVCRASLRMQMIAADKVNIMECDPGPILAHKCMKFITHAGMAFKGLFNVLSTKPVLNKLTSYTALMQVNDGTLVSYIRHCPDPCDPW